MDNGPLSIFLGFDPREAVAFAVARDSIRRRLSSPVKVRGLILSHLRAQGLYWRKHERRDGQLWDVISNAPMSTEFAISRFLIPTLACTGWALFLDADMLVLGDLAELFEAADDRYAVMCVKHDYAPMRTEKMDGQAQTAYPRKNWSSLCLWNCNHPANARLTVEMVNSLPGRDLHRFCWLDDDLIGDLDPAWNYLIGHSDPKITPKIVHFTAGGPWFAGYEHVPYADEWREARDAWAA
jgi:lipopolysaccharide biosynthesis glycosyltransferase